ncbi:glucose 1-dehydrogenase [Ferrimonas sp. SCSIO 43195]|nr:glucose 1-dehydrogenase [Ferrimonas sp. SCSIO 43195]
MTAPSLPFDTEALSRYLSASHPQLGPLVSVTPFDGGASNLTFKLVCDQQSLVLRMPPPGTKAASAHDMGREVRMLRAIGPQFSKVPTVLGYCEDPVILGQPFYLMSYEAGTILRKNLPKELGLSRVQAGELCRSMVDTLVALHRIDTSSESMASLGRPQGYVNRQVEGWSRRYRNAVTPGARSGRRVMQWLADNQPEDSLRPALIHNDFKFDNLVLSPGDPTEIISVLDWEMATLGDPLMDLGCALAYWIEAGDEPELKLLRQLPTHLPGMWSREQIVAYYGQQTGLDVSQFGFYYVFGLFRLAVIVQQIWYRYVESSRKHPAFARFGELAARLMDQAATNIDRLASAQQRHEQLQKITQPGLLQLQGKVALITGASRGIGEAVARLYAAHGARVILSSRDQQALDAVAASIRDQGGQAEGIACHGGDIDQAKALFATIEQRYGRLDILVNNAAANPYFGHILDTPQEALNKTVQVNLAGYFCFAQLAGQMMREQGGGVIINTASVNGKQPAPGQGIYSITKAAVNSMTAAFAKECAQYNIRVNAVLPGLTETKFASALTDNPMLLKQILPLIPQGRSAVPEEIAPAFLFLASDAAAYITGIELPVDGGYLA